MKRPYSADTVVRVFATVRDRSFENTINNNNYSVINDNNNKNKLSKRACPNCKALDGEKRSQRKRGKGTQKSSGDGGSTAIVHSTQLILKAARRGKLGKSDKKDRQELHSDGLVLSGHVTTDLSHRSRLALKPHLNKHVSVMWADTVPVTEPLSGDDLAA